jgi:hypothetical protein
MVLEASWRCGSRVTTGTPLMLAVWWVSRMSLLTNYIILIELHRELRGIYHTAIMREGMPVVRVVSALRRVRDRGRSERVNDIPGQAHSFITLHRLFSSQIEITM